MAVLSNYQSAFVIVWLINLNSTRLNKFSCFCCYVLGYLDLFSNIVLFNVDTLNRCANISTSKASRVLFMFQELPANRKSLAARGLVFGFGVNDSSYVVSKKINGKVKMCPYYTKWLSMICRCYSVKCQSRQPTYAECTVCDEWKFFSAFKSWMKKQDWKGKHLDKDILVQGNSVYSPSTCLFVSAAINTLLIKPLSDSEDHFAGVSFNKNSGKYQSDVSFNGRQEYLGLFESPEEAYEAYKVAKYAIIKSVAELQSEPLKSALLNYKIK